MTKLNVYDMSGAARGEIEIADALLERKKGTQAVHDAVVAIRSAQHQGTSSTLRKGEVAGSGRKPWRQKGTGRARAGYRQSPVWRGGGVVFGPHPRSHTVGINTKTKQLAFRRALSDKIAEGGVRVLDGLELAETKTKLLANLLKSLGISGGVVMVLKNRDKRIVLSARNLPLVEVTTADALNTYQVLRYPAIVVVRDAMDALTARLAGGGGAGGAK